MTAPHLPPAAVEDAAALLRGIADEARFDRRRGMDMWCDPELADGLRELFRTVAMARGAARKASVNAVGPAPGVGVSRRGAESVGRSVGRDVGRDFGAETTGTTGVPSPTVQTPTPGTPALTQPPSPARPSQLGKVPSVPLPQLGTVHARPAEAKPGDTSPASKPKWGPPPIASGRHADWSDHLAKVEAEAKECKACRLCDTRRQVVFGVGQAQIPLLFIGEAPGAEEDRQGIPFVGPAGQLLTKIIDAIGLTREEVYIANILKCRPPANRNPNPDEIALCTPFLIRQLEILRPKAICTLGLFASQFLLQSTQSMGRMRGQRYTYDRIPVIPTYHPAALLRNPDLKTKVWDDVQLLRTVLDESP